MPCDTRPLLSVVMTRMNVGPGSEVVAKADFKGYSSDHMSFFKGDIMTILPNDVKHEKDDNWYFAMHTDNRIGLIPSKHLQARSEVKLNTMPWFHGKITREEAERILQPPKVIISAV